MDNPTGFSLTGEGVRSVDAVPGLKPVQTVADAKLFDIELNATAIGHVDLTLQVGSLGAMALGEGPKATGITADVEMDRQEFLNSADHCDTKIALAYTRANSILEVLAAAFGNAYDHHDKILRAQDASNRLLGDILLNAALAFIPGGAGGVVGGLMRTAKAGDFMIDAFKDMAKAGVRGAQAAVLGGGGREAAMAPMGDDPRSWRAQSAVRVNSEKEAVLTLLDQWKTKARARDAGFSLNFDPATTADTSLVRGGTPLKDVPVPDQTEHEKQFELGMWKDWLSAFGYTVGESQTRAGRISYAKENQGKKVRDRINALGQDGDAWLEQYGGISRAKAEAEAARRNQASFGG
jgi:hypothetical protein